MKHGSHRTFKDITRITREHDALDVVEENHRLEKENDKLRRLLNFNLDDEVIPIAFNKFLHKNYLRNMNSFTQLRNLMLKRPEELSNQERKIISFVRQNSKCAFIAIMLYPQLTFKKEDDE